ncbi:MAG: prolipoprotein diacylglyceryl transferase [Christensenellales bacterium]|jgi:phosphatidylglycerol:prolipoprotein diacylglycerol transferase
MTLPDPVLFSIGSFSVRWYGVCVTLGVLCAVLLCAAREKRYSLPKDTTLDLLFVALPAAIIGARIYYVAFSWEQFREHPISALYFWQGGIAIYGAILMGALAAFVFAKRRKISFATLASLVAPALPLGQAIGRWGNFFNQEAYGIPITDARLQFFPVAVWIESTDGWFAATFFYESLWCFLLCGFLLLYERKYGGRELFPLYCAFYALERFFVEGLRTDSLYWGNIRASQALSLAVIVICAMRWVVLAIKRRRT